MLMLFIFGGLAALAGWFLPPLRRAVIVVAVSWLVVAALLFITWSAWEAEDEPVAFIVSSIVFGAILVGLAAASATIRERREAS